MLNLTVPASNEEIRFLLNVKKNHGIDYLDYDSLEDFMHDYYESLNMTVLICMKKILDSGGMSDAALDVVLMSRRVTSG